jgi:hypothetical protein
LTEKPYNPRLSKTLEKLRSRQVVTPPRRFPEIVLHQLTYLGTEMSKALVLASLFAVAALTACGKKAEAPAAAPAAPAASAPEAAASAAAAVASAAAPAVSAAVGAAADAAKGAVDKAAGAAKDAMKK